MTATSKRPAHRSGASAAPPDGVLVRLALEEGDRLADLPPAPAGADVSVSLSSRQPAAAAALEALGYRTVRVPSESASAGQVADFLVRQGVIEQHPHWWRSLAARAHQVFSLAAGPVQATFAEVLRTHREPLR